MLEYVPENSKILDIGCGSGLWLQMTKEFRKIKKGLGIEVCYDKVETAKKLSKGIDQLEFCYMEITKECPPQDFDVVSMIDVLHHVPIENQQLFIGNLKKINPDRIIFKDIDPNAKIKSKMNTLHDLTVAHQRPQYRKPDDVCQWLEDLGYRITHNQRHDMLWYSHYLIVADK